MGAVFRFPKLGSIARVPVKVEREGEEPYGFEVGITVLGATAARRWSFGFRRLKLEESKRMAALRKDAPDFEGPTEDHVVAQEELGRQILAECLEDVVGLQVGDEPLRKEDYIDTLQAFGLLDSVLTIAIEAQSPRPEQLLF